MRKFQLQRASVSPKQLGVTAVAIVALVVAGLAGRLTAAVPLLAASSTPHVMVIMEENKGYAATMGSCSADPYLCGLGAQYASVTGWTGVSHPSEPNYLAITTGGTQGCTSDTCFKTLTVPSIGGQLTAAGIPWTAYMEGMPSACYTKQWSGGTGSSAVYGEKHNPFVVVADVLNNGCAQHVLPYPGASSMLSTLDGSTPPGFVWITPNQQDDMHSGSVTAGDNWLKTNLAPVLSSAWFTGFNSTVIVTMDEHSGDQTGGGGLIPEVVISSNAKGQGNVAVKGNHYGTLRSIEEAFGFPLLGAAANASNGDLFSLFGSSPGPTPTPSPTASPTPSPTGSPSPSPTPNPATVQCSGDITSALQAAVNKGGTVTISAGNCTVSNHITVKQGDVIEGAGQTQTFIVQTARVNIFEITAPGVTVEGMNLNTATFNPGVPPIPGNPVPGTIYSTASNTSILNLDSEAGTGFGFRLVGGSKTHPCWTFPVSGDVVTNVNSTNQGVGGFTALDVDCSTGSVITNVTIHGDYLALYESTNATVNGLTVTPDPYEKACAAPIFITGPSANDVLNNVLSYGGYIIAKGDKHGPITNLTITNFQLAPGDSC